MISIITINWNADDFLDLMIESLERFSHLPYQLTVIDNSIEKRPVHRENVNWFPTEENIGHGKGLNLGVSKSLELLPDFPFIMFLDVDCHILRYGWEIPFIGMMKKYDMIGGRGVPQKPIRPACMFMRREMGEYDWCDTREYRGHRKTPAGYDVAIRAYYKMQADGLDVGFLESKENRYNTLNGEEWCINDIPLVYHHWHGSHLIERQEEDFPENDLIKDKVQLFSRIPWRLP